LSPSESISSSADPGDDEERPQPVDDMPAAWERKLQDAFGHHQGHDADGDPDPEGPPPREVLDQDATQQGPGDGGQAEDRADERW
jgi:hypothetical protein